MAHCTVMRGIQEGSSWGLDAGCGTCFRAKRKSPGGLLWAAEGKGTSERSAPPRIQRGISVVMMVVMMDVDTRMSTTRGTKFGFTLQLPKTQVFQRITAVHLVAEREQGPQRTMN